MALLDEVIKGGNLLTSLAIGLGAVILPPIALPLLRPVAKTIIRAGLLAYDEGSRALAQLSQATADIVTEAQTELRQNSGTNSHSSTKLPAEDMGLAQITGLAQSRSTPERRARPKAPHTRKHHPSKT
jgi:hypothetical protein